MLLKNESNTKDLALKTINISKKENLVICLNGDLGSGKTTFARYFIQSYFKTHKITDIPSPTFTLLQVYEFKKKRIHRKSNKFLFGGSQTSELDPGVDFGV